MNFAAGGGARPTPGKMDTNLNETYTITNGSHFKWKPHHAVPCVTRLRFCGIWPLNWLTRALHDAFAASGAVP